MKIKLSAKIVKEFYKKALKKKNVRRVGIYLGLAIVALAVLFLVFNLAYASKIFPKTYIGKTNFGGLTADQAKAKLATMIDENKDGQLNFALEDKKFSKKINDLGVDYKSQEDQSMETLLGVGRKGSPLKMIGQQFRAMFAGNRVNASFKYDDAKLNGFLAEIAKTVNKPEKDATIAFKADYEPYVEPEAAGVNFPIPENITVALNTIGSFAFSDNTPFIVQTIYPKIDSKMAEAALSRTRELLGRNLVMKARDKEFKIETKDIPGLLEFSNSDTVSPAIISSPLPVAGTLVPQFSPGKIGAFLDNISKDVNQEAKDSQFKVDGGRVVAFQVSQTGYELQKDEAVKQVIEALNIGTGSIDLPVKEIQPSISSNDPAQAGITELIAEGKTSWRGSPANRIHNLTLGAANISGTIVKPGEEFSTLKAIGEIGPSTGFLQELVIKKGNQVVPDYGGGLCQVSTTLFRAVLNSGLKITARTNHSFRVSYYEPPVGMDATIFDPAPDFKFINDMKTPILIWAFAGNNSLTFQVYGTKDGRVVDISKPTTFDFVQPPDPVYTQSATMAPGTVRQVEKALAGCTASFKYKVTAADGSTLENQTFTSKYIALANSYLYGEGFAVPGAPAVEGVSTGPSPTPVDTSTPVTTP